MVCELIVKNGIILTINPKMENINDGAIAISKGKIIGIDESETILKNYSADRIIDAEGGLILPGFINLHTHVPMTYYRGFADDLNLENWLNKHILPAELQFNDASFVYNSALHGCAEMVRNGITCFNDMYFWSEEIAKASLKVGLRAFLGEGITDYPNKLHKSITEKLNYIKFLTDKFSDEKLLEFTVAPHSIYSCSTATLSALSEFAKKNNKIMHIHLSETKKEFEQCLSKYKKKPLDYINDLGLLENKIIIAHGVFLTPSEIKKAKNISVAINTESNLKLNSGFAPLKMFHENKINFAISTDGVASNNNLDLLSEIETTAKIHKVASFLNSQEMLRSITINPAQALGKENEIGSLELGKYADITILDINKLENQPFYDPYSLILYNLNSSNVKTVIINGKIVMENRVFNSIDETEIIQKATFNRDRIKRFFTK